MKYHYFVGLSCGTAYNDLKIATGKLLSSSHNLLNQNNHHPNHEYKNFIFIPILWYLSKPVPGGIRLSYLRDFYRMKNDAFKIMLILTI